MDRLVKIRQHHWNEHLQINKITKFESDLLKTNEDIQPCSSSKSQYFADICMAGVQTCPLPPTIQMFVNFRNLAELYLCLLKMYHFQIW